MLRLCINRIVNNQCPRASLSARCVGPSIASRLSKQYGQVKSYHISYTDRASVVSAFMHSKSMSTVAYESVDPNQIPSNNQEKAMYHMSSLERVFTRFEDKCQKAERVMEKDFVRTFDYMTKFVERLESSNQLNEDNLANLSLFSAILLRCCGNLMSDSPEKVRELLAGNLWQYIKEKKIPVDISHYNSLIRALNDNQTSFDPKKLLDEIGNAKLTPDRITYQRLIHQYCVQGDINGATNLLEKMKELGMELNELTFASLIIGYSKQETPPSFTEMFDLMKSNDIEPSGRSYAAAIISQANLIPKNPAAIEQLKNIYNLMEKEDINFTINEIVDILSHLAPHREDESVAKILKFVLAGAPKSVNYLHRIFTTLFKHNDYEQVSKIYWSQKPSERAIRSSNLGMYYIRLLATYNNIPVEHSINECAKLKEMGYNSKPYHHLYYLAAVNGNLDLVRATLKKIGEEEPLQCQYFWPLIAQANDQKEIIEVLKNDLNPKMNTDDLLETFAQWVWPRFSENISHLFELNKELQYDNNVLIASFLNYAVQEDKIMEAIKFISEAPQELVGAEIQDDDRANFLGEPVINQRLRSGNERGALIGRLLNQVAEQTKDPAMVNKTFNLCQMPGQQVTTRIGQALVKVHLLNNDFSSALGAFLKLAREHRVDPCKRDLMIHCLENKDPENLQKIMDVSIELYGESNALFDLAICCLQSGKYKQAQKIFCNPGFRVSPVRVYQTCRYFQNNISVLENFVLLTRDLYDINKERLYQFLINAYERTGNGKRALDLWNKMQEEEFQPSRRSLFMIAKVLEQNNIEVPFRRPKMGSRDREIEQD